MKTILKQAQFSQHICREAAKSIETSSAPLQRQPLVSLKYHGIGRVEIKLFDMQIRIVSKGLFSSIQQFTFLKQIGLGSFGSVKMAIHINTNKIYAIKIVELTQQLSENQLLILEREINLHSQVDHPHIIKLWDTLQENQHVYMVMELAENGSLFTYQNYHPTLPEEEAFKFFQQSLSAIKYLHSQDIMHRDIKPQNILLDGSNSIKICDLGWATDKITSKRKTFCGTYEYMAPEMAFEKEYDYKIDIWALGVLLFELVHGYAPFKARSLEEIQAKIKKGYYEVGKTLSKELKTLIIQILQFDYTQRPELEQICGHPWVQLMKKDVRAEALKMKQNFEMESKRKPTLTDKQSNKENHEYVNYKKQRKYDSSLNQVNFKKQTQPQQTLISTGFTSIDREKDIKNSKLKKKCKTQGEESIERLLKCDPNLQKHYGNAGEAYVKTNKHHMNYLTKMDEYYLRTDSKLNHKKLQDKINEISTKYTAEKKKGRFKTPNNVSKFN